MVFEKVLDILFGIPCNLGHKEFYRLGNDSPVTVYTAEYIVYVGSIEMGRLKNEDLAALRKEAFTRTLRNPMSLLRGLMKVGFWLVNVVGKAMLGAPILMMWLFYLNKLDMDRVVFVFKPNAMTEIFCYVLYLTLSIKLLRYTLAMVKKMDVSETLPMSFLNYNNPFHRELENMLRNRFEAPNPGKMAILGWWAPN